MDNLVDKPIVVEGQKIETEQYYDQLFKDCRLTVYRSKYCKLNEEYL